MSEKVFETVERSEVEVGDYVTFTVTTRGSGRKKAKRQIIGFDCQGEVLLVKYDGWSPFYVGSHITDVIHGFERHTGFRD